MFGLFLLLSTASACTPALMGGFANCYRDSLGSPLLPYFLATLQSTQVDPSTCLGACLDKFPNTTVIGLEGGIDAVCYCGPSFTPPAGGGLEDACGPNCPGNKSAICGGTGLYMTMYTVDCGQPGSTPPGRGGPPQHLSNPSSSPTGGAGSVGLSDLIGIVFLGLIGLAIVGMIVTTVVFVFVLKREEGAGVAVRALGDVGSLVRDGASEAVRGVQGLTGRGRSYSEV